MSKRYLDHEIARIFPLLSGREFGDLVADIKSNGLREAVVIYEGKILDGRNRYRACEEAGVEAKVEEYDERVSGSPVTFVISVNLRRRHLTESQKAAVAQEVLPWLEKEAKARQVAGGGDRKSGKAKLPEPIHGTGQSRDAAAKALGVSARYVSDAKAIKEKDEELFEEVKSGKTTLSEAKRAVKKKQHKAKVAEVARQPMLTPAGPYDLILADPPWRYDFSETGSREVENQYPTASVEEIGRHKPDAKKDAVLFLWATAPKLLEALRVMEEWGFGYVTHAIWDKEKVGMGYWFRGQHELLLVGVRGKPGATPECERVSSVFREARTGHSKKPLCVYEWIERAFPGGKKLEMYCRKPRVGWGAWGNEV